MDKYKEVYDEEPVLGNSVEGWWILSINGDDALDVLREFNVGTTKDPGSRFNLAVNGYGDTKGYYAWRPIGRLGIPDTDSLTYVLVPPGSESSSDNEVSVTTKWMGIHIL